MKTKNFKKRGAAFSVIHASVVSLAMVLPLALVTGCVSGHRGAASGERVGEAREVARIQMASGVNANMLGVVEQGKQPVIYCHMKGVGDPKNENLLFPLSMAQKVDISDAIIAERLKNLMRKTTRFDVRDGDFTVVENDSYQEYGDNTVDLGIYCMVVDAFQEMRNIAPMKKAYTKVKLSVTLIDRITGASMFDSAVEVDGEYGLNPGEGALVPMYDSLKSPESQTILANDYKRALDNALDAAVDRIQYLMRPVGSVTVPLLSNLSMFGGFKHGFRPHDEIVVFRAFRKNMRDGSERIVGFDPIAEARCDGVQSTLSQCVVTAIRKGADIKDGDFTVLADKFAYQGGDL